jgi:hypothetical protein
MSAAIGVYLPSFRVEPTAGAVAHARHAEALGLESVCGSATT